MILTANNRYQAPQSPSGFKPFKVETPDDIKKLVTMSDYSPSVFACLTKTSKAYKDGMDKYLGHPYRCNELWESADSIGIDIDGGLSIAEFQTHPDFRDLEYIIITSRNHQKPKGDEQSCDRYHVLFPVSTILTREKMENALAGLAARYPFIDAGAKDAARFFFGFKNSEVIWHHGCELVPPDPPADVFIDDIPDGMVLTPTVKPEYKWNGQKVYQDDKRQKIMAALRDTVSAGLQYQDWIRIGMGLKAEGYSEQDWHYLLTAGKPADSVTLRNYQSKWDGFHPEKIDGGTLMYFARLSDPNLLKKGQEQQVTRLPIAPAPAVPGADSEARQPVIRHISAMGSVEPDWLIDGMIERRSYALMFGESGHYKSFVSLDWAFCVAAGIPWEGKPTKQGPVLYMFGEGGSGLKRRFMALSKKYSIDVDTLPIYYDNNPPAIIDLPQVIQRTKDILLDMPEPPAMIVIDTLNTAFGAGNENATEDMTAFNNGCHEFIVSLGCTIVLVHHSGISSKDRSRGNSALKARLDHEYQCEKDEGALTMTLSCRKMKDSDFPEPMFFQFEQVQIGGIIPMTSGILRLVTAETAAVQEEKQLTSLQLRVLEIVESAPNGVGVVGVSSQVHGIGHTQKNDQAIKKMLFRMYETGIIDRIRPGVFAPNKARNL